MPQIISHRANLYGPDSNRENKISSIKECLEKGFDVEIDLHFINNKFYLGHDEPQEETSLSFLNENRRKLWIHCKNFDALNKLINTDLNFFWHENDSFTLTSWKFIWTYPNNIVKDNSIIVCQTEKQTLNYKKTKAYGICTDWVYL